MPRLFCLLFVLFSLLTLAPPTRCQSTDFASALSGTKHPLTLKLKELNSTWRRISLGSSGDPANQLQIYAALFSGNPQNYY